jgi:hypothetical protein
MRGETMTEMEEFLRDDEPFLVRQRSPEELADYDAGFEAAKKGKEWDDAISIAEQ